ncbi:MAG: glycosyltransferase family 87 protein [Bacteroidota bacterium]
MKVNIKSLISDKRFLIITYTLFALAASILSLIETKTYDNSGIVYNGYNNYTIFEKSFEHLKNNQDLYVLYPEEHWDLYKYTPSFSVFFGIFNVLPDWLGLSLWNILNAVLLLLAIYYLPKLSAYQKGVILLIMLIELMTSMQNAQSNGLIAGLLVFAFGLLERNKFFWAAMCVVFSMFIKLFGIAGFLLFFFYPQKWKSALYAFFWTGTLLALPLLFVEFTQYIKLFSSYWGLLINDHDASYGYSVMGWIHSWLSIDINKNIIVAAGGVMLLLPLYKIKLYNDFFYKYLMLSSVLIWIVIFNHKAESPTFIIAMTGVALWYNQAEKKTLNIILLLGAIILTSLSPTDIFPKNLRDEFVKPYVLKAFPVILIWIKIIYDLIILKENRTINRETL